jgi:L-asparaginase
MTPSKKICLIYTGGTIGMKRVGKALKPPQDPEDFIRKVAPELPEIADFDYVALMNKDSTNINHEDWAKIAEAIYSRINQYQGFVIAHGTDTMHFTASAVAFALGENLNCPVVFTGSQTNPDVRHGDARVNLVRAFQVCATDLAEVAICFGEFVFRGCRAQKKDERRFDAFESPAYYPIAYITEQILLTPLAKRQGHRPPIEFNPFFADGIIQFSLIPGLEPDLIVKVLELPECSGLLLQSFGAGNVPSEGKYSLLDVIKQARNLGKPTVVTSQFAAGSTFYTQYETGLKAITAGAIATGNMTNSCAVAKFRWVLANVDREIAAGRLSAEHRIDQVRRRMQTVYVDEMDSLPDRNLP